MRRSVITAALALALAACGSSTPAPPTASQLAHKIPGAHACISMTPDVTAKADVSCALNGTDSVDVVTFATMGDETRWITGQSAQPGCCVEGHLFAATFSSGSGGEYFGLITGAIGGREVNG